MKCFVVSNCTHAPLNQYLAASGHFERVDSCAIFNIPKENLEAEFKKVKSYDVVVSAVHYGAEWGPFECTRMKELLGDKLVLFTTPFFSGLHPDLIHVSHKGARFPSPISDYHSGLVFWGYMTGQPIEKIVDIYNSGEFPSFFKLDKSWEDSLENLRIRDKDSDIVTADIYDQVLKEVPGMLTFNHPTMDIIGKIGTRVLERIFGPDDELFIMPNTIFNNLLTDVIVPIYPVVRKLHGLAYNVPTHFKVGLGRKNSGEYISFSTFAKRSYAKYGCVDSVDLLATTPSGLSQRIMSEIK